MKRQSNEKPYLSWCVVVRNGAPAVEPETPTSPHLANTLRSLRERTPEAEIVVVDTCSRDATHEVAARYADVFEVYRGPRGDWDEEMAAVDDMAAARQRSFELASGRWRGWIDADDRLPGPEEAQRILVLNGRWRAPLRAEQRDAAEKLGVEEATPEASPALEDVLRALEVNLPEVTMITCPYLYMRDEKNPDLAITWLDRERIVRWDDPPNFRWQEPAHEVLVPIRGFPKRFELPHVLWIHDKVWTPGAFEYSFKRHSKILLDAYDRGDVTFRRARYLAGFAATGVVDSSREKEFVKAMLDVADTVLDRSRAETEAGSYYARRGLAWESRKHFAAAHDLIPGCPDSWYAEAAAASEIEDWDRAAACYRRGIACVLGPESEVNPRAHVLDYPSRLSVVLQEAAKRNVENGQHDVALLQLREAAELADRVRQRPEVGPTDQLEAASLYFRANNAYVIQQTAMALFNAWVVLRRNDEPVKALSLLAAFPHAAEDHPLRVGMELEARPVEKHVVSSEAYRAFYESDETTGFVPMMHLDVYLYEKAHPRVRWLVDEVTKLVGGGSKERHSDEVAAWQAAGCPGGQSAAPHRRLRVLDIGCSDGITGVAMLQKLGRFIEYHGVDVNPSALRSFTKVLAEHKLAPGIRTDFEFDEDAVFEYAGGGPNDLHLTLERGTVPYFRRNYDVVLAGEIVEHVPRPPRWLQGLVHRLRSPGGVLLLTCPWGSYDEGHPPEKTSHGTPRDARGHLRAYTPASLARDLEEAGFMPQAIGRVGPGLVGDSMVARAVEVGAARIESPVAFAVRGALWDWNGSVVDAEGIGASEEMIVRLAEKLAPTRKADVYGPVPAQEVYKGVGYYPRGAIRHVGTDRDVKVVVSRAPSFFRAIDDLTQHRQPMVLWLQDVAYPAELDDNVADRYDWIVAVSEWHREVTIRVHGLERNAAKVVVAYNFLQREHWEEGIAKEWAGIKKPDHFIWASSPDRGVVKMLELWPRIRDMFPEATLDIFYGWKGAARLGGGADPAWNRRYLSMRRKYEKLRHQPGVTERGLVNHYQIAVEYQRAGVWAYPTVFSETGCLSACKARAGGAVPVTTALAALNETAACAQATLVGEEYLERDETSSDFLTYGEGYDEAFLAGVRAAVEMTTAGRVAMAKTVLAEFDYEAIKPVWEKVLA